MQIETSKLWNAAFSALFLLFFALILALPGSYNWGIGSILLLSLAALFFYRKSIVITRDDISLFALLSIYPFALLIAIGFAHGKMNAADYPGRLLFAMPFVLAWKALDLKPRVFSYALGGVAIGCCIAGSLAIKQIFFDGLIRAGSNITNEIPYGQIAAVLALFSFCNLMQTRTWPTRCTYVLASFMGCIAMLLSGTRGAWLGFVIAIIVILVVNLRKSAKLLLITLAVSVVLVWLASAIPEIQIRIALAGQEVIEFWQGQQNSSIGVRMQLWQVAIDHFKQSPWLGSGPGNFAVLLDQLALQQKIPAYLADFNHAHSQYFDSLVGAGSLGFSALLLSFFGPLWLFIRRYRIATGLAQQAALMGCTLIVFTMFASITQPLYAHNISVIFYLVCLCVCWHFSNPALALDLKEPENN